MLFPYVLKYFSEQLNELKVNDDGVTTMEKFADTTSEINPKNHHIWGLPVYVLDSRIHDTIGGFTRWERDKSQGSYLVANHYIQDQWIWSST